MNSRLYYEHDYENKITTQYIRKGECNGCGECCRNTLVLHTDKTKEERDKYDSLFIGYAAWGGGTWVDIQEGDRKWAYKITGSEEGKDCSLLCDNGQCSQHSEKNALANEMVLCDIWPGGPSDLKWVKECSYSFEVVETWPFDT